MFGNAGAHGLDLWGNSAGHRLSGPSGDRRYLHITNDVINTISQGTWTLWDMSVNGVLVNNTIGATVDLSASEWYLPDGDYLCVADVDVSCSFSGSNSDTSAQFYLDGSPMPDSRVSGPVSSGGYRATYCEKITVTSAQAISLYGHAHTDCGGTTASLEACSIIIIPTVI